jgi:type IV pilus assembly protein PilV
MLLEALIAILIFSLGVLGVVGMQVSAVSASRDAKYRADAALLANELVGQMWSGNRVGNALQANFQGDGPAVATITDGPLYDIWLVRVGATLPGVVANPPLVTVTPGTAGPPAIASVVSIVVRWQAPSDLVAHSHRVLVDII